MESFASVHVRGATRDRCVALVVERFAKAGFELLDAPPPAGAAVHRLVVREAGAWCSLFLPASAHAGAVRPFPKTWPEGFPVETWQDGEWAAFLSQKLKLPVLALFQWAGEGSTLVRRLNAGKEASRLEVPRDSKRGRDGRARAPSTVLGPWLPPAEKKKRAGLVLDAGPSEAEDADDETPFVSRQDAAAALADAIGLAKLPVPPAQVGEGAGERVLVFRRAASKSASAASRLPLLPPGCEDAEENTADIDRYRGRDCAVGFLAFDASAGLLPITTVISDLLDTFCPPQGYNVRITRGELAQIFPKGFTRSSKLSERQLARGGSIELSYGNFAPGPGLPLFWVVSQPPGAPPVAPTKGSGRARAPIDPIPLYVGWSIAKMGNASAELAVTQAMNAAVEAAAATEGCIAALLTAEKKGHSVQDWGLPYEGLAGTSEGAGRATWLREHLRSPGWHVLVPKAKVASLDARAPKGLQTKKVKAGLLVRLDGETPFSMGSLDVLERFVLSAIGTDEELGTLLRRR